MNSISSGQGQSITISSANMATVVTNPNALISHRVVGGMEEDEEDDDMDDGGDDSDFGEDDEMMGVSDVTSQLAAAGWQHGVEFVLFSP